MNHGFSATAVWLVMLLLTLLTYALGKSGLSGAGIVLILLSTAMIKGGFIIHDFMELRGVSLLWRIIMYGWLSTVCLVITITYMMSL